MLGLTDAEGGLLCKLAVLPAEGAFGVSEMLTVYGPGKAHLHVMLESGVPVFHSYLADGSNRIVMSRRWGHLSCRWLIGLSSPSVSPVPGGF